MKKSTHIGDARFFQYYWDQGIKLPSIDSCPGCSKGADGLFRDEVRRKPLYKRGGSNRSAAQVAPRRVSVHDRLGPHCDEEQEFHEEFNRYTGGRFVEENQLCPSGIFNET